MHCPAFTLAQARRAAKKLRAYHSPMAARIALAHLKERPDYYARLRRYVER